jgi:hypothetical protein
MKLDLFDAPAEFTNLGFLGIVQEQVLRLRVVQIDLAHEGALGVVKMAALRLDRAARFAGIFLLPFRNDVIVRRNRQ